MTCAIPDGDDLFRSVIFPLSFQKNKVFQAAKFFCLYTDEKHPGLIETSVIWERYAPTLPFVHGFGCRLSASMNEAEPRPKQRRVYCGAYQFTTTDVRQLKGTSGLGEVVSSDVLHKIERNEIAHASIEIQLGADVDKDSVEGTKTAIIDRLWQSSRGPIRHVCDGDIDLNSHPSGLLMEAPGGPYIDNRSPLLYLWCNVRFAVLGFWLRLIRRADRNPQQPPAE